MTYQVNVIIIKIPPHSCVKIQYITLIVTTLKLFSLIHDLIRKFIVNLLTYCLYCRELFWLFHFSSFENFWSHNLSFAEIIPLQKNILLVPGWFNKLFHMFLVCPRKKYHKLHLQKFIHQNIFPRLFPTWQCSLIVFNIFGWFGIIYFSPLILFLITPWVY